MTNLDLIRMHTYDDVFAMIYLFPAQALIEEFGVDGEAAVRQGVRNFGVDRGVTNREKQLQVGLKLNMFNYFTYLRDLPGDPRFTRDRLNLVPQERISHTFTCPFYDMTAKFELERIGRIYCEEFHDAAFSAYTYGNTQVNLARTLTQDGDPYCSFSVLLRPENLSDELKKQCFEEYDPLYEPAVFEDVKPGAKEGYKSLSLRLFYHMFDEAIKQLGEQGKTTYLKGLENFSDEVIKLLKEISAEHHLTYDQAFVADYQPFYLELSDEGMWEKYSQNNAAKMLQKHYINRLLKSI